MRFDMNRLRGNDPTYSPLSYTVKGRYRFWRASKPAVVAGYFKEPVRLPGIIGDGQDAARAHKAQELTLEMLKWLEAKERPTNDPTTWRWIFQRYLSDEYSPIREVKINTARSYAIDIAYLEGGIGEQPFATSSFVFFKTLQREMAKKGKSIDFIARKFRMLRIVAHYGLALNPKAFREICEILSVMRIQAPRPKSTNPTEDEVMSIVAAADQIGETGAALGFLLQWWLALRAVDVRGQMLGARGDKLRWADGLTWDMINMQAGTITKVPSKTERSSPEPMIFDISGIPELMQRLQAIPMDQRVGPVIRRKGGLHFTRETYGKIFRKCRIAAGVRAEVKNMDTRAGAINHALKNGATPLQMQHQANHASLTTTQRYIRAKDDSVADVIALRTKGKPA